MVKHQRERNEMNKSDRHWDGLDPESDNEDELMELEEQDQDRDWYAEELNEEPTETDEYYAEDDEEDD